MMLESAQERFQKWNLNELLMKYPALRIEPSPSPRLVLAGTLAFRVVGPKAKIVEDEYDVAIRVSPRFPEICPTVSETAGRIPEDYHKLEGNMLCLGAPTALRLRLTMSPTLLTFVDEFVIPYLAGYSHFAATGEMLFGELKHGSRGIREYLAELFHSRSAPRPEEFVRLASLMKRRANKCPCPCGSGRRLGRCHNRIVNSHRQSLGRKWFAIEYQRLLEQLSLRPEYH